MNLDRRTMMAGTAAALMAAPGLAKKAAAGASWYDRAIVIDALGGVSDPYSPDEQLRLGDRAWAEMVGGGVTMVRDISRRQCHRPVERLSKGHRDQAKFAQ